MSDGNQQHALREPVFESGATSTTSASNNQHLIAKSGCEDTKVLPTTALLCVDGETNVVLAEDVDVEDESVASEEDVMDLRRNGLTPEQQQQLLHLLSLYHLSRTESSAKRRRLQTSARSKRRIKPVEREPKMTVPPVIALQEPRTLADPAPVGLLAFGMTTLLLNFCNAGLMEANLTLVGMAFAYGGAVQFIAGILEFCRGNTYFCTVDMTYGAFWIATGFAWCLPADPSGHDMLLPEANKTFLSGYMTMWSVFAFVMFVSSFRLPYVCSFLFLTTFVTFITQCVAHFTRSGTVMKVSGYAGMVCGSTAMYVGFALQLQHNYDREILPLLPQEPTKAFVREWWRRFTTNAKEEME